VRVGFRLPMRFARGPVRERDAAGGVESGPNLYRFALFHSKTRGGLSRAPASGKTFAFTARSGAQQPSHAHGTSSEPARFWVVRTTRVGVRARGVAIPDVWRTRRQPRSRGVCQKRVEWVGFGETFRTTRPGGHAPGSSSCLHLRASPPRRWRSRRGPSSSGPSRRFGEARASRACAVPAV
jgi:hypothetical protein